ncbi:glycosyltransferase [bacterium]|nr:glycosyltransferase [bacterium]
MSDEFNIAEYLSKETDINNVKERLFVFYNLLSGSLNEVNIYKFLLGMFDLTTDFEYYENPLVSIIIPVKNEYILTAFLLNSIHSYTKNIPYEIIIADDNSEDQTTGIENRFKNINVVKNDINKPGFLYNVSKAIKYARGKYILLLNNDMMVFDNYLDELLKVIEKYNDIGIVGSKNIGIDNKIMECGVFIDKDCNIKFGGEKEGIDFLDEKEYIDCDYCSGCSILFRKETWDKSGGFDENYAPAYYEDSDFALNVRHNLNLKSVCVPKSKIYHYRHVSYIKNVKSQITQLRNKNYFSKKWGKYLK